ncbi:hypothetical protein J4E83_010049 [Alternaria metachromatica]|uniref:uncharacterized protein n=1 Tax=Alternaria metachromatica TaxID=283354 RepID=UPI0020C353BF|nr:uncharacterized protein J4E83_010049 [Alternaria metachromatica]XP_049239733.1 uncharacterized protein J4E84_009944 [Alternaria hordeiaustralica]XP_051296700.1 uncharacterized protein J4E86_011656 [Alternaria arbusti]XP_051320310.1 uncharacterized protein J4E85_011687 [Alternaria conjuncta]KAI4606677.1 hypothetical protein J4E80_009989 [Alternaria sp. BMP 0032]KAI4606458.1 hypothetical protein J4E83_010049 [Alternaria metachromatica]KAI4675791.1 hypothetical protein J4E84_009944 [Alternari
MADVATPPAAQASTNGAAAPPAKQQVVKPDKPDEDKYKEELAKLEKEHAAAQEKLNACKAKLDLAKPNNKDSPNAKRQQELKTELNAIRSTQQGNKSGRNSIFEKIKKLDEQLKQQLNELKTAKGKSNYKSAEDVDQEIARLQKQVDGGMMKLVDEKKALAEISALNKAKKNFSGFDSQQKKIDDIKAQIAEQKKLLDDPENKALSEKYTKLQTELDGLKAEQDEAFKNLRSLREETDKARAVQQEKYQARKELKDNYFQQLRAFKNYEFEARKIRNEKRRLEQLQYVAGKRKETASKRLEEASAPAYGDEIIACEGLIRHFDPSALPAKETTAASKFAASAQRTVDDSGLKGTRISKKDTEEESYMAGTGGKKGKKGKKGGAAASKFNLNIGIIEELAKVGVDPPSSQDEVPATVEKLQAKLAHWKEDQDRKTKENIAKAQKEIDKLEAEEAAEDAANGSTDAARKPAQKNQAVNGDASAEAELAQEKDAAADAADDLKKATIEDKETAADA